MRCQHSLHRTIQTTQSATHRKGHGKQLRALQERDEAHSQLRHARWTVRCLQAELLAAKGAAAELEARCDAAEAAATAAQEALAIASECHEEELLHALYGASEVEELEDEVSSQLSLETDSDVAEPLGTFSRSS